MPKQKVVLVTGGSSGIGYAIAQRYLHEGFQTVITGRNQEKLDRAVERLGKGCTGFRFDMTWLEEIPGFVEKVKDTFGGIDILINNAGINQKKPLLEVTDKDFENIVKTNQTALFVLSREVAGIMVDQKDRGVIIHISSMTAFIGIPKVISYTASKTALEGITRSMAVDLSPLGIRVNSVAPGFIQTPMSSEALDRDPERKNRVLSRTPMGKLGQPEDIANAVFFLTSDQASFITGQSLRVDGGFSIGF